MTLPVSIPTTYTPGSPVLSADLNAIMACIVGAKHPALPHGISAAEWAPKVPANGTLGAGQWTGSGAVTLVAGLSFVPAGDRITTVNYAYNVNSSSGITLSLRRRKMDGTAEETLFTTTDATGSTFEQNSQTYNHTVASGYVYYLQADLAAGAILLGAVATTDCL